MNYLPRKSKRNYRLPYGCRRSANALAYAPPGWTMTTGAISGLKLVFLVDKVEGKSVNIGIRLERNSDLHGRG